MAGSAQPTPKVNYFTLPSDFTFIHGRQKSSDIYLAYLDINPTATKTALIPTCFRGRLATTLNFSTGALRDHRILVIALFGNGESSSPSNSDAGAFPDMLDYRDCVHAQRALLAHLDISSLDVVAGFSMAGQCTYYWAAMYPEIVRNAVVICSSARTSRHNFQFLEGPKAALMNSADYVALKSGRDSDDCAGGLRAFGKAYSAWLTSAEWFEEGCWEKLGFESQEAWDFAGTVTGYKGWHPDDLLAMLGMWQRGDIGVVDDVDLQAALGKIKARVLVMPSRTDQYFRWEASEKEVHALGAQGRLRVIESIWGHTAGGGANPDDIKYMDSEISKFLADRT